MERVGRGVPRQQAGGLVDHLSAESVARGGEREDVRKEDSAETLFVVGPCVRSTARNRAAPGHRYTGRDEDGPDERGARGHRISAERPS